MKSPYVYDSKKRCYVVAVEEPKAPPPYPQEKSWSRLAFFGLLLALAAVIVVIFIVILWGFDDSSSNNGDLDINDRREMLSR